ncbi:hypothetical protein QFW77_09620 [Luteimonas sp. RD2P54]|uniref:C-type lysozyme inhibitor domain-containing protein n=1 Tax=Luteimonas endophytica TaxID=3042023 RepID=A0ABT6JAM5_9GAMM|nr:hypothetical protein [Luteimonas endophytica]MDH5823243.1 hypothetical protein [Luteimonas endophytica]
MTAIRPARSLILALAVLPLLAACRQAPAPSTDPPAGAPAAAMPGPPADPASSTAAPAASRGAVARYQCGELAVGAHFADDRSSVELAYSGRRRTLSAQDTDKYADDAGNVFHAGEPASLALAGEPPRECAPTEHVSPWEEAAGRGIAFRAVGQEPGWLVEVGSGESPTLSAQLDYGERRIEVDAAVTLEGGSGFRGETSDGRPVDLAIARAACADPMSGERFEASATLRVGEREYRGCGAYLED